MSGSGKGGNSRKNRHHFSKRRDDLQRHERKKQNENILTDGKYTSKSEKNDGRNLQERLHWTAPLLPTDPITTPDCSWCGKQIKDIVTAINDKDTGKPVHFDCVLARINSMEKLGTNDTICYIGGGRFGVVHYNNPPDTRDFSIKKIYEWEIKDSVSQWRSPICEYYSIT